VALFMTNTSCAPHLSSCTLECPERVRMKRGVICMKAAAAHYSLQAAALLGVSCWAHTPGLSNQASQRGYQMVLPCMHMA